MNEQITDFSLLHFWKVSQLLWEWGLYKYSILKRTESNQCDKCAIAEEIWKGAILFHVEQMCFMD